MLSRADFAAEAAKVMLEPASADRKLTLVAVDELADLQERLGEETGRGLNDAIERYLCSSGNVEAAGQLGDGRYGLIHTETLDTSRLQSGVATLSRTIDPHGKGVSLRAATMALGGTGLEGADAARALVYCINQFADSESADLSLPSLRDGLDKAMAQTIERVSALRSTVSDRDFTLVFQPIVHLAQRSVHHVEALARFRNGSPGETVAFAEAVRLIADFDLAVCEQVAAALLSGEGGELPVAVNVSGRSLESELFCSALLALLKPQLAKRLLIEITESAVISHLAEVNRRVQTMRNAGFRVCLDDFGAGANSFHYLRAFEVDFVKIDGPFVKSALANPRDAKLIGAVAGYCREVGIATIGEMVEDEPAAQALQQLGIDYAQGYHFGKPIAELGKVKLEEAPPEKAVARRNVKRKGFVARWG
jgi:EAL domain-containing protein (putative c-di-GMP-specific phosphodiesterase class I)